MASQQIATEESEATRAVVGASLALASPIYSSELTQQPHEMVVCEGWVLKKRRKRMQGFARRYFTLYASGTLSYAFEPGQVSRDQIYLGHAAISSAPGRKDIHIDSPTVTFHIKCITTKDFEGWMAAFRAYISDDNAVRRKSSLAKTNTRDTRLNKTALITEEIGQTVRDLETAVSALQDEEAFNYSGSQFRSKSERPDRDKHREPDQPKEISHVFALFKKSASHSTHPHDQPSEASHISDVRPSLAQDHPYFSHFEHIQVALDILKSQHLALTQTLSSLNELNSGLSAFGQGSIVPATISEESMGAATFPNRYSYSPTPASAHYRRTSTVTSSSDPDGRSIFFDAEDEGPEEFVLDTPLEEELVTGRKFPHTSSETTAEKYLDRSIDTGSGDSKSAPIQEPYKQVIRRTELPSRSVGDEGSLFAMLRKNVGKDLSTITLPATFNEPLTLLQRAAEEVEYYGLLHQAASASDPTERLCYVSAFAVSGYANTKFRSGRKGFTPLLGETFEDPRMKFIAEKVCHNPLVIAYHAEGEGWELYATSSGKTKFWGKSLEIIPTGTSHVKIGEDHFCWKKPSSFMRNLMIGSKYLEHSGEMTVENTRTGARCELEFKETGYWASTPNVVVGQVLSPSGKVETYLEGKWDENISQKLDSSHLRVLWRVTPYPKNAPEYYGFTSFGITLNEITDDLKEALPPTDSRYRPDVRALEEGDLDVAEKEKARLEDAQRQRRQRKSDREPRWFEQVDNEWIYVGGYWEQRDRGWESIPALF